MTEKQKMLEGTPYDSRDGELLERYHVARSLMAQYNTLDSRKTEERIQLLHKLCRSIGSDTWIEPPFYCDYGDLITIGSGCFINCNCMFQDNNLITIGHRVLIGPYVQIYTANHPVSARDRNYLRTDGSPAYHTSSRPVIIGDDVWIGGQVIIFPGVVIGSNVTIGAGSIVTHDIPNNSLAYGNPCRVMRSIE